MLLTPFCLTSIPTNSHKAMCANNWCLSAPYLWGRCIWMVSTMNFVICFLFVSPLSNGENWKIKYIDYNHSNSRIFTVFGHPGLWIRKSNFQDDNSSLAVKGLNKNIKIAKEAKIFICQTFKLRITYQCLLYRCFFLTA